MFDDFIVEYERLIEMSNRWKRRQIIAAKMEQ